ncbi:MAG TPA: hypothetical protein VFN09_12630, partial [Rhodanobacteraceae bacterium]|nr:hypothetical protein [Rhodanobacteraceae bacterium]
KNPARDGCFRAQLHALRLFHPGHGWLDAPRGSAAWAAAVGGFGLSGLIIEAQLQLAPAPATVALQPIAVDSLAAAAAVLDQHRDAMLLYGWHDARPHRFGRGIIRVGHARAAAQQPAVPADTALPAAIRPLPLRLWSPASLALANTWMRWRWQRLRTQSLAAALLPLDGADSYFAAYGPRGLIEAQWLWSLPRFPELAERLAALVRQQRPLIPLLSSKLFDGAGEGVAFDGKGVALALHVLADARGKAFLRAFNALALAHGGRPNPIKQSGLDAETLRAALPDLDGWRMRLDRVDGERLFRSELSRRLAW